MNGDVSACTQTVDLAVDRRLADSERKVFTNYAKKYVDFFRSKWVGWVYANVPADARRNTSLSAWKSKVQTTQGRAVLLVVNDAQDRYGRGYSAFIHRAGKKALEWQVVASQADAALLPALVADMQVEISKNAALPADPKKLRARAGGKTVRAAGVIF